VVQTVPSTKCREDFDEKERSRTAWAKAQTMICFWNLESLSRYTDEGIPMLMMKSFQHFQALVRLVFVESTDASSRAAAPALM
jgi:hypothetical protein